VFSCNQNVTERAEKGRIGPERQERVSRKTLIISDVLVATRNGQDHAEFPRFVYIGCIHHDMPTGSSVNPTSM
jgi:hypothetical protein